jgi:hypothetical protein
MKTRAALLLLLVALVTASTATTSAIQKPGGTPLARGGGNGIEAVLVDGTFSVVNNGATAYRIDGVDNPTLILTRGLTYAFNVNSPGHPFFIKTAATTGTGNQYTNGVTGNGVTSGTLTFTVPLDAPSGLFYQCSVHSPMHGSLTMMDPLSVPQNPTPASVWLAPPAPNPAHDGALFTYSLPREAGIVFAIFDARGRRVRTLDGGITSEGSHSIRWDGRDLSGQLAPSGVYFYRLQVDGQRLTGRLVVAR